MRATANKQICAFKHQVRNNISRCNLTKNADGTTIRATLGDYLKPSKARPNSLAGVGILGKHATVNCNVVVTEQEARQIAEALLHLSRTISKSNTNEYILNLRNLIPL